MSGLGLGLGVEFHNIVDVNMSCKSKIVSFKTPPRVIKRGFQKKLFRVGLSKPYPWNTRAHYCLRSRTYKLGSLYVAAVHRGVSQGQPSGAAHKGSPPRRLTRAVYRGG